MRLKQIIANRDEEICVLEIKQHAKIKNDTGDKQHRFLLFTWLLVYGIRKKIINDSGKDNQHHKEPAGFVKKIEGEKDENITAYFIILPEPVIQSDKNSKEENKEAIIE